MLYEVITRTKRIRFEKQLDKSLRAGMGETHRAEKQDSFMNNSIGKKESDRGFYFVHSVIIHGVPSLALAASEILTMLTHFPELKQAKGRSFLKITTSY